VGDIAHIQDNGLWLRPDILKGMTERGHYLMIKATAERDLGFRSVILNGSNNTHYSPPTRWR
jgi:hypothetical protein